MPPAPAATVRPDDLRAFIAQLFEKAGVRDDQAATMAEVMTWASVRGVDTHGTGLVATYLKFIENGVVNLEADVSVDQATGAVAVVKADRAPGPVALTVAADLAVERARTSGVAAVAVQQTVHAGAIGYYTDRIAEAGLVGLAFVAGMPNMGYLGVKGAAVATSPLSVAVPGGARGTVLLDMATATIAMGKIKQHKANGTPLPEGAAATADGVPTTDPELAEMPLPLGGAKGSGMSLVFELITSVLAGAPILASFHAGVEGGKKHRQNALIVAFDPAAFGDPAQFLANVDATVDAVKSLPTAPGFDAVTVPGERSSGVAARRSAQGIPVSPQNWAALVEAAERLGVSVPTP